MHSAPGAEAALDSGGEGGGAVRRGLTRWRSDAVQLEELLRGWSAASNEASPLARGGSAGVDRRSQQSSISVRSSLQHGQSQQGAAPASVAAASLAAGPSVVAKLPPIPAQGPPNGNLSVPLVEEEDEGSDVQQGEQQQRGEQGEQLAGSVQLAEQSQPPMQQQQPQGSAEQPVESSGGGTPVVRRATAPPTLPLSRRASAGNSSGAEEAEGGGGYASAPGTSRWAAGGAARGAARIARSVSDPREGLLGRTASAPATSFDAYARTGVKLRGGTSGLVKCGLSPSVVGSDAPSHFARMASTGARVSGGLGPLRRPDSSVDLTSPETSALVARIRKKLERPVSDRLLQVRCTVECGAGWGWRGRGRGLLLGHKRGL